MARAGAINRELFLPSSSMLQAVPTGPDSIRLAFEGIVQPHVYPGKAHLPRKLVKAEQHSRQQQHDQAAEKQQQQGQQQVQRRKGALSSKPLPWRALHHLSQTSSQRSSGSCGRAALGQAFAHLVSAFLDTRPMMTGQAAEVAVIKAIDKRVTPQGWRCLLQLEDSNNIGSTDDGGSSQAAPASSRTALDLTVRYTVGNNEKFFNFQASTAVCQLPHDLQEKLLKGSSSSRDGEQLQLMMTVIGPAGSSPDAAAITQQSHLWVPVEAVLTLEEQAAYPAGKGSVAVCAPPVHTDAYAYTLVAWQAFQQQMGVQQVYIIHSTLGP